MEKLLNKIIEKICSQRDKPVFLQFFSSKNKEIFLPQTDIPYVYIVLEGGIQLHNPEGTVNYKAGDYFISNITTASEGIISGNKFSAIAISFLPDEVISVLLELDNKLLNKIFNETATDNNLVKILNNLEELLNIESNSFLSGHFKKEIIFYLLTSMYGKIFIQNIFNFKNVGIIYEVNSWIKENYKTSFSVGELAKRANMSVSGFHQKFKNAIGMGPIHCQKKLRLIEARTLMFRKGLSVTEASFEVGYESLSQFNRDYRQLFGETPKKDMANIQNYLKVKGIG